MSHSDNSNSKTEQADLNSPNPNDVNEDTKILSNQAVQAYIERHQLDARVFMLATATPTVERSAEVLGTHPERIIKSLIFLAGGEPQLVIAAGLARIDEKKLRDALGVSRKQLRLAKPAEALEASGYVIGSMPPFGHRRKLPTLLDSLSIPLEDVNTIDPPTATDTTGTPAGNTDEAGTNPAVIDPAVIYYAGAGLVSAMMALSLKTLLAASAARAFPLSRSKT
jgi:prolyl-tRNA editing enzyme YbaK/EbsC (Cys-tRNA(Pro) deacylase)